MRGSFCAMPCVTSRLVGTLAELFKREGSRTQNSTKGPKVGPKVNGAASLKC